MNKTIGFSVFGSVSFILSQIARVDDGSFAANPFTNTLFCPALPKFVIVAAPGSGFAFNIPLNAISGSMFNISATASARDILSSKIV